MNNFPEPNDTASPEEDLNTIIKTTSEYYLKRLESYLVIQDRLNQGDKKREMKELLDFSKVNFKKINSLLAYGKDAIKDAEQIQFYREKINSIHQKRMGSHQQFETDLFNNIEASKLPTVQPEISSYILNTGNYGLLQLNKRGNTDFNISNDEIYQFMDRVIKAKLAKAILPPEKAEYNVENGILKVSKAQIFSFEMTLFFDPKAQEYNWRLLDFEHKARKFKNIQKKIERLNNEIAKIYTDNKRGLEAYIISFIVYKMHYFNTRKKLKNIIKKAESFQSELKSLNSEDTFDITQKMISNEMVYLEISYWKNSLINSLNTLNKFNRMIFQLPNLSIFNFIESFRKNRADLFSGLSSDDVTCLFHEPNLPDPATIEQLQSLVGEHPKGLYLNPSFCKQIKDIVFFKVSKKVKLFGLSLESNFLEIFNEVKRLFGIYQLLYYLSVLDKVLDKSDLENIRFHYDQIGGGQKNFSLITTHRFYIGINIQGKILRLSVDSNGRIDFGFEFLDKEIGIHQTRFNIIILKEILRKDPLKLSEVIILYKKILIQSGLTPFLLENGAKFYPEKGLVNNFKTFIYRNFGAHYLKNENTTAPIKISFSYKIEFDDAFEKASVKTTIGFMTLGAPQGTEANFVNKPGEINLVPFDLEKILEDFRNHITEKRCLGYYNFEITKQENESGMNSTVSLNETQKFLIRVSPELTQTLSTSKDTITLTFKPQTGDYYQTYFTYKDYIYSHHGLPELGTKLVFQKLNKSFEIYDKDTMILKYPNVIDIKIIMQKEMERLENFIKSKRLKQDEEEKDDDKIFSDEFFAYSNIILGDIIWVRFYLDKLFSTEPSRYQYLRTSYIDASKSEKSLYFTKKLFVKELRQALPILKFGQELSEKKVDWGLVVRPNPEADISGGDDQIRRERERAIAKINQMLSNYFLNIHPVSPWHFIIYWRNYFNKNLMNFFFKFQIVTESEYECFGIYYEPMDSVKRKSIDLTQNNNLYFAQIKDIFDKFAQSSSSNQMNGRLANSRNNEHNQNGSGTNSFRIKINNKVDLLKFLLQATHQLIKISEKINAVPTNNVAALSMNPQS